MARTRKSNKDTAKKATLGPDEARCMTCKVGRKVRDPKIVTLSNGRKMMRGTCSVCNGKVVKFVKNPAK